MPSTTDEALARKREKFNAARRARRAAARDPVSVTNFAEYRKQIRKGSPEYRRTLPPMREMSKSELRAMLSQAAQNTVDHGQV